MAFVKATKEQAKLRLGLVGPSGSGKSYSGLAIGTAIARACGGRLAALDTEHGSLSKYADVFDFDHDRPVDFDPRNYIKAIKEAAASDHPVIFIDSLSHAWMGKGGALEMVDKIGKRNGGGSNFAAWRDVTPIHNELIDAIVGAPIHVIATMRAKQEYIVEKDERGKTSIRKVGLQPVQRDGMEYEFDVVGDLDQDNNFIVSKTRCPALSQKMIHRPGEELAKTLMDWLTAGAAPAQPAVPPPAQNPPDDDPLSDNDKFAAFVEEALDAADFHPDDRAAVVVKACTTKKVPSILHLSLADRHGLLKAIMDGKFDKLRKPQAAGAK